MGRRWRLACGEMGVGGVWGAVGRQRKNGRGWEEEEFVLLREVRLGLASAWRSMRSS